MTPKIRTCNGKDSVGMDLIDAYFDGVNASISHIFANVEMKTELNNILIKSVFEFTLIFGDSAKSLQGEVLENLAESAAPLNLETFGRSQQQIMKTNLHRNVELLNRSMELGRHMLSQIPSVSTAALNESKSSS